MVLKKNKKNLFIKTFGCQMNEYDSNRIYDSVSKLGFTKTKDQSSAECYILITCHTPCVNDCNTIYITIIIS